MSEIDKELVLFCDESDRDGKYYSNFYGGVLVGSGQIDRVVSRLNAVKSSLNVHGEVKWAKTSEAYLEKYKSLVSAFFEEVRAGRIKVRVMFSQNARRPVRLTPEQTETSYFRLYYQFIKHAFGFRLLPVPGNDAHLRLFFDEFPDKREHAERFKGFIFGLQMDDEFKKRRLKIRISDIAEVRSHDHILMQCLDVVLGAMTFRLNDKHLAIPPGERRRGKRTIAKEKLYKHINAEIRQYRPGFNIGESTGRGQEPDSIWTHHYRHWKFVPTDNEYDESLTKGAENKKWPG